MFPSPYFFEIKPKVSALQTNCETNSSICILESKPFKALENTFIECFSKRNFVYLKLILARMLISWMVMLSSAPDLSSITSYMNCYDLRLSFHTGSVSFKAKCAL